MQDPQRRDIGLHVHSRRGPGLLMSVGRLLAPLIAPCHHAASVPLSANQSCSEEKYYTPTPQYFSISALSVLGRAWRKGLIPCDSRSDVMKHLHTASPWPKRMALDIMMHSEPPQAGSGNSYTVLPMSYRPHSKICRTQCQATCS